MADYNSAYTGAEIDTAVGVTQALGTISTQDADALLLTGSVTEAVYALTDGATVDVDPANGTIQTLTLTGTGRTLTFTNMVAGQAITLMIDDGAGQAVTWPTMTWINNAGAAPTLATTGYTTIQLWKVSTTLYGALVGDGS